LSFRIDESVIFNGLSKKDLRFIVKMETKRLGEAFGRDDLYIERCFAGLRRIWIRSGIRCPSSKACHSASLRLLLHEEFSLAISNDGDNVVDMVLEGRIGVRRGTTGRARGVSGAFD
jgi:hypothetical protein